MQTKQSYQGIVSLFNRSKNWGFITPFDKDGEFDKTGDIFVHNSNCADGYKPQLGDLVEYEVGLPFKLGQRPQAVNVRAATEQVAAALVQAAKKASDGAGAQ